MKENLYVIATRGIKNKEIYLGIDEGNNKDNILMKWTENIVDAYALFDEWEIEEYAKKYFKNYKKWYIKKYECKFE
jgi:hypothetical protein